MKSLSRNVPHSSSVRRTHIWISGIPPKIFQPIKWRLQSNSDFSQWLCAFYSSVSQKMPTLNAYFFIYHFNWIRNSIHCNFSFGNGNAWKKQLVKSIGFCIGRQSFWKPFHCDFTMKNCKFVYFVCFNNLHHFLLVRTLIKPRIWVAVILLSCWTLFVHLTSCGIPLKRVTIENKQTMPLRWVQGWTSLGCFR